MPKHKFPGPLEREESGIPPPSEVPPPGDDNLRVLIESVARLVSRCGKLFEDLSREKNRSNPLFGFLSGGVGHDYYERKLWEERKKFSGSGRLSLDGKSSPSVQKMTAESRGRLLGEKPLERILDDGASPSTHGDFSHLQVNLTDTFTKPASFVSYNFITVVSSLSLSNFCCLYINTFESVDASGLLFCGTLNFMVVLWDTVF